MKLSDVLDLGLLEEMVAGGFIRRQTHPTQPLAILNYTEKAAYDGVWNEVTLQCRGLIIDFESLEVLARPFPKFFNHGQPGAPELDLDAEAVVTDKLDGSLGILYPTPTGYAIATRGSFTSEQAEHATDLWGERYSNFAPLDGLTYLFEIIYEDNRIVVDYGNLDDLVLLAALDTETGRPIFRLSDAGWPGPCVETFEYASLAEALAAEPRPNCEGLVVHFPDTNERVKIKQDDYVALHRILTGTNARNVWEVAAVRACAGWIKEPKHWGSFLGIDPARAIEVQALGDAWLADVPDEFYGWVEETTETAEMAVAEALVDATNLAEHARRIKDRRSRFEFVQASGSTFEREIMRLVDGKVGAQAGLYLRAWREACPAPTSPFARTEDVA